MGVTPLLALAAAAVIAAGNYAYWSHEVASRVPPGLAAANGRIEVERVDVATKHAGRVASLEADEGDLVARVPSRGGSTAASAEPNRPRRRPARADPGRASPGLGPRSRSARPSSCWRKSSCTASWSWRGAATLPKPRSIGDRRSVRWHEPGSRERRPPSRTPRRRRRRHVVPAVVSFVAAEAQFTPKAVETADEREKLMYRVKLKLDPKLLEVYRDYVKAGLTEAAWPAALAQPRLPHAP